MVLRTIDRAVGPYLRSASADPAETTRVVLDQVGVRSVDIPTAGTAKLATSVNAAWVERFNA